MVEVPVDDPATEACRAVSLLAEYEGGRKAPAAALAVADDFPLPVILELVRPCAELLQGNMKGTGDVLKSPLAFSSDIKKEHAGVATSPARNLRRTVLRHRSGPEEFHPAPQQHQTHQPEKTNLHAHDRSLPCRHSSPPPRRTPRAGRHPPNPHPPSSSTGQMHSPPAEGLEKRIVMYQKHWRSARRRAI
jgi:hypothetical protein